MDRLSVSRFGSFAERGSDDRTSVAERRDFFHLCGCLDECPSAVQRHFYGKTLKASFVEGQVVNKQKKTKLKRWLTGIGIGLMVLFVGAGWYIDRVFFAIGEMRNEVYQEVKSPDGKYVATLAYSDGLTYGYYSVSLQTIQLWHPLGTNDSIPKDEVAEVAAEGVDHVSWHGNHKLVIDYEKTGVEAAEFTLRQKAWRDVQIAYQGQ